MQKKYRFTDGNEIERAGVDTSVLDDWLEWSNSYPHGEDDEDYHDAHPVYRVVWVDRLGDTRESFFEVMVPHEIARMSELVESVGSENVLLIDTVTIRITKTSDDLCVKGKNVRVEQ